MITLIIVIGILVLIAIGGIIGAGSGKKDERTVNSQTMHRELNEERKRQGKSTMTQINGDTNTYARKDKSWRSSPDFFIQLIKGRRE